ncbi:hypothetical protein COL154_011265 [Colletotrichum chrysophilum]|uniref:Uncharacterized protein n=2 Tax=Colletotrichum chrysophilum TaxID=1836956 RepID=A0AAD9A8Q0_9PEZI|nr:hypothetical protein KNSL1_008530 [Colletotrichum chrysophilum]KAJ0355780.1 hypothetical protein COL154_011265 [Colletotrichum chrysophilum]KAK1842485.1 hypothetical protein CCHR01_14868 [Colletotrichum chrysophilum]
MDPCHSPLPEHAQRSGNVMSVGAVMSDENETSADAGSVSSETIMSAASASGGDEAEQPLPPTTLEEMPENLAESSRENRPSKQSDEDADYEKRMEEYRQRYEEDLRRHFPQLSNDDEEDDEDDEDDPLDPFTQSLLSAWDPETDTIDPRIHNPDDRDDPTPLPPQIETDELYMDDYIPTDWQQAYKPGTSIVLVPHKPANPHGYAAYATSANVNPSDWGYNDWLLARSRSEHALHHRPTPYTSMTEKQRRTAGLPPPFERDYSEHPTEPQASVSLKLVKFLSGGPWSGPAVFLCEVTQGARAFAMPQRVVAKFQDPMFFQASPPPDQLFAGVYQEEAISPDHILVAPAAHGRARVAMIHYRDSLVDCK